MIVKSTIALNYEHTCSTHMWLSVHALYICDECHADVYFSLQGFGLSI